MKDLSTDNILTIAEIVEDSDLVDVLEQFKNTKETDAEKVGLQIFVKVLSKVSKTSKPKFYGLLGELTDKDPETIKNQPIATTFGEIKAILSFGENAKLLKDFF